MRSVVFNKKPFPMQRQIGIGLLLLGLAWPLLPLFAQDGVRRGAPITLNFQNAELEQVARTLAIVTGRTVVVDPRAKAVMSLQSDKPLSPAKAWAQFTTALRLQGFAVVSSDGIDKIMPEAEAKLQAGAVQTRATAGGAGQIATQIFKLNYENANNIVPILRPLISPNNTINVNPTTNSVVITDYGDNLQRMAKIIASLDVPTASDVEIIPLRHAIASELAPLVARLSEGEFGGQADGAFKTTIAAENRSNSLIIRAANPARLSRVRSLITRLDQPSRRVANGDGSVSDFIHVVRLKNAEATKLAITLRALLQTTNPYTIASGTGQPTPNVNSGSGTGSTGGGTTQTPVTATSALSGSGNPTTGGIIQADPATNTLIITAPEAQFRQIKAIIDKLDERRAQVYIEALIAEVSTDKAAEFGIQWQAPIGRKGDSSVGVIGTNFKNGATNIVDLSLAGANPSKITSNPLGGGINLALGKMTNGVYYLASLARFLESAGDTNILSTPNILTLDNEEARIVIGQNVPFVTGRYTSPTTGENANPFQTVERKDIGLTLRVKPQISENGNIRLQVFQEVSSLSAASTDGLITNKRSIESNVLVEDGSIVVLGGLVQDDFGASVEKVPFLGDIPVLGNLFKVDTRKRKKTNLMIFLRPVVMRDAVTTENFSITRYDEMRGSLDGAQPTNSWVTKLNESPTLNPASAVLQEPARVGNLPNYSAPATSRPFTRIPPLQAPPPNGQNRLNSEDDEWDTPSNRR